jgi:hypothetical protein
MKTILLAITPFATFAGLITIDFSPVATITLGLSFIATSAINVPRFAKIITDTL